VTDASMALYFRGQSLMFAGKAGFCQTFLREAAVMKSRQGYKGYVMRA